MQAHFNISCKSPAVLQNAANDYAKVNERVLAQFDLRMRKLKCLSFALFICQVSRYLFGDKFVEFVHTKSIWYTSARAFDLYDTNTKIKSHLQSRKQLVQVGIHSYLFQVLT